MTTTLLTVVGVVIAIIKFLLNLNTKVTSFVKELLNFKAKSKPCMAKFKIEIKIELVKLQKHFDKYDGANAKIETYLSEIQT